MKNGIIIMLSILLCRKLMSLKYKQIIKGVFLEMTALASKRKFLLSLKGN